MTRSTRTLVATAFGLVAVIPALHGQDPARYRDYQLGTSLASVSAITGPDLVEGPRRERDRQKKEAADAQTLLEQQRLANKAAFRP